jgi:hypothetical protein
MIPILEEYKVALTVIKYQMFNLKSHLFQRHQPLVDATFQDGSLSKSSELVYRFLYLVLVQYRKGCFF